MRRFPCVTLTRSVGASRFPFCAAEFPVPVNRCKGVASSSAWRKRHPVAIERRLADPSVGRRGSIDGAFARGSDIASPSFLRKLLAFAQAKNRQLKRPILLKTRSSFHSRRVPSPAHRSARTSRFLEKPLLRPTFCIGVHRSPSRISRAKLTLSMGSIWPSNNVRDKSSSAHHLLCWPRNRG